MEPTSHPFTYPSFPQLPSPHPCFRVGEAEEGMKEGTRSEGTDGHSERRVSACEQLIAYPVSHHLGRQNPEVWRHEWGRGRKQNVSIHCTEAMSQLEDGMTQPNPDLAPQLGFTCHVSGLQGHRSPHSPAGSQTATQLLTRAHSRALERPLGPEGWSVLEEEATALASARTQSIDARAPLWAEHQGPTLGCHTPPAELKPPAHQLHSRHLPLLLPLLRGLQAVCPVRHFAGGMSPQPAWDLVKHLGESVALDGAWTHCPW